MNYEKYMKKCFKLALKADGKTSPNPMVGCVVLDENGKEISQGYHKKCGEKHAEADALSKIETGHTLIVNLEPCSHYGKTPPCSDLIIKKGIKKVVIAMRDVNPIVSGNGIKKLKAAGIDVVENVLHDEAEKLNEVFIKNMTENKCFIATKTASTLDGKIATYSGDSKWITCSKSREYVQKLRNKYDAIMTTSTTVINDNPMMNCRFKNGKNPIKIVIDRQMKTDLSSKIYSDENTKVYIAIDENCIVKQDIPSHIEIIKCKSNNNKLDVYELTEKLYEKGIRSILIEAGGIFNGEMLSCGLIDKIYHFVAPKILCDNTGKTVFEGMQKEKIKNALEYKTESVNKIGSDILITMVKL
jgi:diaminohydroxyphosphoribosylaminopyrimidine deaminase/5-amino-6-(5-phosphoribosylamino)uracil reductase